MLKWTYEACYEEAKKYNYKVDFIKNSRGAYDAALRNKWLEDYNWFLSGIKRTGEKHRKWNYETCYNEALKYSTRGEFGTKSQRAYYVALQNGWLDNYIWLKDKRFDLINDKIDCIYVYEFAEQKAVYIGRTLIKRQKERDWEHIFRNDSVSKFAKENNIAVPEIKILETNLTIKEGAENEGIWIELYKEDGWNILNKAPAGSIGSLGKGKWNYKSTVEEAKKYKSRREFRDKNRSAYNKALEKDWLDNFNWLKDNTKHRKEYWTEERCLKEAKKYNNMSNFRKECSGAYLSAKEHNWLEDYTWLETQFKWTEKSLLEEARKYKTRGEFAKEKPGAYEYALKYSLLDKCTWFEELKKPNNYWTYERCLEESKKYKSRGEYRKENNGSYKSSLKHGWLDEFFPKNK